MYYAEEEEFVDSNLPEIIDKYTEEIIELLEERGFTIMVVRKNTSNAGG